MFTSEDLQLGIADISEPYPISHYRQTVARIASSRPINHNYYLLAYWSG